MDINMKKTDQKRVDPHAWKRNRIDGTFTTFPLVNTRKTQRNEPCPCGRKMIITDQVGQEFERPIKFKNCCLN